MSKENFFLSIEGKVLSQKAIELPQTQKHIKLELIMALDEEQVSRVEEKYSDVTMKELLELFEVAKGK